MEDERLIECIEHALSGSAICFLGAGFSTLARDSSGKLQVPGTFDLTEELWQRAGTPKEEGATLTDLADFFEMNGKIELLRQHLISRLTLTAPSEAQRNVLSLPWRAIFTTNFDDVVERCLNSTRIQVVSPGKSPTYIRTDLTPVYYLHGRALDLIESANDPRIVISESNYLYLKERNADTYASFVNEVHAASQIFFIGYSIKDADVAARILSFGESLRKKSLVVCGEGAGAVAISRLQKFGEVAPIGVEGISREISLIRQRQPAVIGKPKLTFLRAADRVSMKSEVTKDDVDRLILTGEFDASCFAAQEFGGQPDNLYCVSQTKRIDDVLTSIEKFISRFLITSDIGNGKSTFLAQLTYRATDRGYLVYKITSAIPEIYSDIDQVLASTDRVMFVIDDLIRYRRIAEYIGKRLRAGASVVCATRDNFDSLTYQVASELLSGTVKEIALDALELDQLGAWDKLLERWGYWESRINLNVADRIQFLKTDCSSENRSIVISVFKSSQVSNKIDSIVRYFLNTNVKHMTSFVAILITSLCQKHVQWDQIVSWLRIDEDSFRAALKKEQIFDFLSGRREWYLFTSSQLADHIFRNYEFDRGTLVEVYTTIVRETAYSSSDVRSGQDSKENLKELMKFRFLSRLFGEGANSAGAIESVYSRLSKVPKIRSNDQFWLQYAMSCMEKGDLENAETYINTALGLASKKGAEYYDYQIVDQRVRLLLMKNARQGVKLSVDELQTAIADLSKSLSGNNPMLIYPMRSSTYILNLVDEKIDMLDAGTRSSLLQILNQMRDLLMEVTELPKSQRGETKILRENVRKARLVLQNA